MKGIYFFIFVSCEPLNVWKGCPISINIFKYPDVWKNARHVYLKVRTFLCVLIYEFPNTNKMGTGLQKSLHYDNVDKIKWKWNWLMITKCPYKGGVHVYEGILTLFEVCEKNKISCEIKSIYRLNPFRSRLQKNFYLPWLRRLKVFELNWIAQIWSY